jgi:hypothetical protein
MESTTNNRTAGDASDRAIVHAVAGQDSNGGKIGSGRSVASRCNDVPISLFPPKIDLKNE